MATFIYTPKKKIDIRSPKTWERKPMNIEVCKKHHISYSSGEACYKCEEDAI